MTNETRFVVFLGVALGIGASASIGNPDWMMGFLFGIMCCLAVGGVFNATKLTELKHEMALTDAKLEVLKELQP